MLIVGAVLATASVATTGGLLLFADSGVEAQSAAPAPATTRAIETTTSTTTTSTTTTTTTTTTTLPPPRVTLELSGDSSRQLTNVVLALYTWMADPAATRPRMPTGMAPHLAGARADTTLELRGEAFRDELADGTGVAVVRIGDDIVLAATEDSRWTIVGAKLTSLGLEAWYGDPVRHVLIIGTDARPHQPPPEYRADSIHIVSASLTDAGGGIVGFPRDTWVAASYGSDKFSSVNVRGSTDEMVSITEELSGAEIEGYILTGFAGFKHMVNVFGGVEVDVPFRMADDASNAFLDAGLQVLKGGEALAFSRNRQVTGADFTRSRHQGIVMMAGLTGAQAMGIERLPALLRMLTADTWTDLPASGLLQLGAIAFEIDPANVGNTVLPGTVGAAGRISVVRLTSGAAAVFDDLADGVVSSD